jgi:hypothetical protein
MFDVESDHGKLRVIGVRADEEFDVSYDFLSLTSR